LQANFKQSVTIINVSFKDEVLMGQLTRSVSVTSGHSATYTVYGVEITEREDEINILYVALTRAKNNMIVFKKAKSSVFDILNMKPIQIGTIIESENLAKNYEKIEKISYISLDLGIQEKQISFVIMNRSF
jgi:superfamily I DNA/RNA helicase